MDVRRAAALLLLLLASAGWAQDNGFRPLPPEQLAWKDAHMVRTTQVLPTTLGLGRENTARTAQGLPALDNSALQVPYATTDVLPTAVDNSTLPSFPPIRAQGTVNSCVAFANTYYLMTHMVGLARGWNVKDETDNTNKFSPAWAFNMIDDGLNEGGPDLFIYRLLLQHGAATWAECPYVGDSKTAANYLAWPLTAAVWRDALNYRMAQAGYIPNMDTDTGLALLKEMLVNGFVLNVGSHIDYWQFGAIGNAPYQGRDIVTWVNNDYGGHSATIVGFDDTVWVDINHNGVVDPGERGALRIANSYGPNWVPHATADGGFTWVAYDALRDVSAVPNGPGTNRIPFCYLNEVYWMTARPSYTPELVAEFTLSSAKRNQVSVSLGGSDTTVTAPTTTWGAGAVQNQGGAFAFDGGATAVDGTFVFDATDLFAGATPARWYLQATDTTQGDPVAVKSFKLTDVTRGVQTSAAGAPVSADNATAGLTLDYTRSRTLPTFRPDLAAHTAMGAYVGDLAYDIASQTLTGISPATFAVRITNRGADDTITLTAPAAGTGWSAVWYDALTGGNNISAAFTQGMPVALTAGSAKEYRVVVTHVGGGTASQTLDVSAVSGGDATKTDTVRLLTNSAPLSAVALAFTPPSPAPAGTPISITALPTGGGNVEYKFWVGYGSGTSQVWTVLRDYGASASCPWTPTTARGYGIEVWAREVGSTKTYDVYTVGSYTVALSSLSGVKLAVSPPSPQRVNTNVTLTATAIGGKNVEYQFRALNAGATVWTTLRGYSTTPTLVWRPAAARGYTLEVWAREVGSKVTYSYLADVPYTVTTK